MLKGRIKKPFVTGLLLLISIAVFSQDSVKHISVEVLGSAYFNNQRLEYRNGDQAIYKEIRLHYRLNQYLEAGIFAGQQWRSFIYYKITGSGYVPLFMDRNYIPAGIDFRFYITDIFSDKLHWIKNKNKWEVYSHLFLCRLWGNDKRDPLEAPSDTIVYLTPYVIEYGKIFSGVLLGVALNPSKNIGFFLEAGEGPVAYLQIGFKIKM